MLTLRVTNLMVALVAISGTSSACSNDIAKKPLILQPTPQSTANRSATSDPIRSIDFANFSYPGRYVLTDGSKSLTLREGRFDGDGTQIRLAFLNYGDVTGDGIEDAIVTLAPILAGTATPLVTYVYTLERGTPRLLWAFSTGDRADGGLRRVYSENGKLVIERFSSVNSKGACCPTQFTRTTYAWDRTKFKQSGSTNIPNPTGSSDTAMPDYQSSKDTASPKS